MTDPAPAPVTAAPAKQFSRRDLVGRLRTALEHADPGTLAALRRADPKSPPPAFYRLTVALLDEHLSALADGALRDDIESRWALVVSAMATAQGYLTPTVPLGEALAKAGVSETRLLRLLEAQASQLPELVRGLIQLLVQKGQSFDPNDLANLVLARDDDRQPRRHLARTYYRHEGT